MENNFNSAKETALLQLYAGYLQDTGLDAHVAIASNSEAELDVLQINLSNHENLQVLFVPLGEANFKTISLLQFYTIIRQPKRNELETLKLVNALNRKIPVGKLSSDSENSLEYHYYLPAPSLVPFTKEEFMERFSLILMQLEAIFSIWPLKDELAVLLEKIEKL
jgi:hypothetical protein